MIKSWFLAISVGGMLATVIAQENHPLSFTDVVERFSAEEEDIQSISVAQQRDATFAVAICGRDNVVSLSFGSGGKWRRIQVDRSYKNRCSVKLVDLDGDQHNELVVAGEQIEVFGLVGERLQLIWTSDEILDTTSPPRVAWADVTADGFPELVVLNNKADNDNAKTKSLYVFQVQTKREIEIRLLASLTLADKQACLQTSGLAVGNYVGDRRKEIAVGNDNGILWLIELIDGKLNIKSETEVPRGGAIGPGLASAQMDLDLHDELLIGTNGGFIFVCDFDAEMQPNWIGNSKTGRLAYGVTAADLDGDGIDEFIASRGESGYAGMTANDCMVQVFQFSEGRLVEKWNQEAMNAPRTLVQDIDGDGKGEIIVYGGKGDSKRVDVIRVWPNEPSK